MFVVDTNVLSEVMKPAPALSVAAWIAATPEAQLFTTTICQAEVFSGIALLPPGRRRDHLETAAWGFFEIDFGGRVLAFDRAAAEAYADVVAKRRNSGHVAGTFDPLIAAIARSHDATVVTRDSHGFGDAGVPFINPWKHPTP